MTKRSAERRLRAAIAALPAKQRWRLRRHGQERRPITLLTFPERVEMSDGTIQYYDSLATIACFGTIPPDPDVLEEPEYAGMVRAFCAMQRASGSRLMETLYKLGKDRVLEIMADAP